MKINNFQDKNIQDLAGDTIGRIREIIDGMTQLNIIVAGKTGVGKSTLINAMFRENMAQTGVGRPVTQHMRIIEKKGMPLKIYDTKGFELSENTQKEILKLINKTIQAGHKTDDPNDDIHCMWYCINTTSNRIEESEIEWLRSFTKENSKNKVPVIVVLTQAISQENAEALRQAILAENLDVAQIVPVLAKDYRIDENITIPAHGLENLLHVMSEVLPEELQDSLNNTQIVDMNAKISRARKIMNASVGSAVAVVVTPIPAADAVGLVATQLTMIASITASFGVKVEKGLIISFLSAVLGTSGMTYFGRALSSFLIKYIPGAGTIISAGTAAALTAALGETYIQFLTMVARGELKQADLNDKFTRQTIGDIFKRNYRIGKRRAENQGYEVEDLKQIESGENVNRQDQNYYQFDGQPPKQVQQMPYVPGPNNGPYTPRPNNGQMNPNQPNIQNSNRRPNMPNNPNQPNRQGMHPNQGGNPAYRPVQNPQNPNYRPNPNQPMNPNNRAMGPYNNQPMRPNNRPNQVPKKKKNERWKFWKRWTDKKE